MKILITGANGYLGKGVVKTLLDKGHTVIATDLKKNYIDTRATIKCVNLFDINNPFEYFEKPDILLHMAWRDGFIHNSENHIKDLNSHYLFIKKMIQSGVKHVAILGSMHEIGFHEGSINENTPTNPQNLYGISKDTLRKLIELETNNSDIIFQWLRGFYIVSNTVDGCSIFSKIIQSAEKGEKEFPFTKGLNQFDFLDYKEFCEDVAITILQDEVKGIINICSGQPEKLSERVERFIKENKLKIKLKYGAFPDRPYDSKAMWGDDSKLNMIKRIKERS